jgi:hypothetical protein
MDERDLELKLAEELIGGWDVIRTGEGFLINTDWQMPNRERIEIHIRAVGEREDLYVVADGGDLFNLLYAQQVDLSKDEAGMEALNAIVDYHGAKIVDFQIAKGANDGTLAQAVRKVLESVKDASFLLWHKVKGAGSIH